jgi:hypothetical protein
VSVCVCVRDRAGNIVVSNAQGENASGLRWAAAVVVTPVWRQTELFHSCFPPPFANPLQPRRLFVPSLLGSFASTPDRSTKVREEHVIPWNVLLPTPCRLAEPTNGKVSPSS